MRKKFLVVGFLVAILIVPILVLGVLLLASQEGRTAPPAITGLTAIDAHDGQIDLVWSPSDAEDFAYYAIYASETEITDVTELSPVDQINDRTDVTYQITKYEVHGLSLALVNDTEYWFAVTAVDLADNESKVGTSVSATPEILPPPPPELTSFIAVDNFAGFQPATITVPIGTTVAWTSPDFEWANWVINHPHTVISDTGLFRGELKQSDSILTYTFTEAGVFGYHCELHVWETGEVIVE